MEGATTSHVDLNDDERTSKASSSPLSISLSADDVDGLRRGAISTISLDRANDQSMQARLMLGKKKHRKPVIFEEV